MYLLNNSVAVINYPDLNTLSMSDFLVSKKAKATNLSSVISLEKKELLRWDSNPRHTTIRTYILNADCNSTIHDSTCFPLNYYSIFPIPQIWDGVSNRCVSTFKEAHSHQPVSEGVCVCVCVCVCVRACMRACVRV